MIAPPKMSLGKARLKGLESGEYRVHATRVNMEERKQLKELVAEHGFTNNEDMLEYVVFQFLTLRPYTQGFTFYFPCTTLVSLRGTNESRRTGWRQLNIFLGAELSERVHAEVRRLATVVKSLSMTAYLYTAIRWFLETHATLPALESRPNKTKTKSKPKTKSKTQSE